MFQALERCTQRVFKIIREKEERMKGIILAGGSGTRFIQ